MLALPRDRVCLSKARTDKLRNIGDEYLKQASTPVAVTNLET